MKDLNQQVSLSNYQDPEQGLVQAKDLIRSAHFSEAIRILHCLAGLDLEKSFFLEVYYMLAVAQRYQMQYESALKNLQVLISRSPTYSRAYQEQGHCFLALNKSDAACHAFEKAVKLNPGLVASWKALVNLYGNSVTDHLAKFAREQVEYLESLPIELVAVIDLLHEGKLYKAENLCREYLNQNKHHIEAMRLLAEIGVKLKIYDDSEFLLESCVEFDLDNTRARTDYINLLNRKGKFQKALEQAERLLERQPDNFQVQTLKANALVGVGKVTEAVNQYKSIISRSDTRPGIQLMLGHAQKAAGEIDNAIDSYHAAIKGRPNFGDAFWSLANTKTYQFFGHEIEHMKQFVEDRETANEDKIHICFALGKAYEDKKEYAVSFKYYERGNALKKQESGYKADIFEELVQHQIEHCTSDFFRARNGVGSDYPDPVFIVGLPRAGSTLLEQIIASHSMVDGTMELHNILSLVQRLRGRDSVKSSRYPGILRELDPEYFKRFGEQFINDTRVYRGSSPYFIDKMPNNFLHIGLIHLILPNAKIIDARREPMACGFSNFKQLFGEGQDFSYNLKDIGRYYKSYVRLMAHWDEVLPGKVLRVMHEDVVNGLEQQIIRILDYLQLPYEQSCLEFYKTDRTVRTPSSEQVRKPIYSSGIEQWKNYQSWLGDLSNVFEEKLGSE